MKKLSIIIILLLVICCPILMCNRNRIGSEVTIRTECIGCYNEETLDKAVKYANEKNEIMFSVIARSNSSKLLFKGQHGTITKTKKGRAQIELSTGEKVWVLDRHIKHVK